MHFNLCKGKLIDQKQHCSQTEWLCNNNTAAKKKKKNIRCLKLNSNIVYIFFLKLIER
jgi:hypothetical protein